MKKITTVFLLSNLCFVFAQVPAYYNGIDFTQTGLPLKNQLATLINNTHTTPISYDDVWDVLITSDLDPTNNANVLLIYGYNDLDGNIVNDRTRDKNNYGGSNGQWNREHTFAKSLGSPDLGTVGPGSDAHNLRASDVQMNGDRGNRMFANGSGNAGATGANWYPGDEWKGDCARIVMYMYLRYGLQCRPIYVGVGTQNSIDANMVDLFLTWNAADPVSEIEENRNNTIQSWQGNRNPFIDNPFIATRIWGGTPAEDTWGGLGVEPLVISDFVVYPVPSSTHQIYVSHSSAAHVETVTVIDQKGAVVSEYEIDKTSTKSITISEIPSGTWIVKIQTDLGIVTKKIIVL